MTRLAVKESIRARIAAQAAAIIANTTTWTNVITLRQVPKFEKLGTGLFIIAGPSSRIESRLSGSRGAGQKKAVYRMRFWMHAVAKDDQQGGDDFDLAWENFLQVMRSMNSQIGITDPVTGVQSWLHEVAETIEDTIEEPKLSAAQGLVRFFAEAHITVEEVSNLE